MRKINSTEFWIVTIAILAIALSFAFNMALSASYLNKRIEQSVKSTYEVVSREMVKKIEYSLKYGKSITHFYGMQSLFDEVREQLAGIENVSLTYEDKTLYALDPTAPENSTSYHIYLPIDQQYVKGAVVDVQFSENVVAESTRAYMQKMALNAGVCILLGIGIPLVILWINGIFLVEGEGDVKRLLIYLLVIVGLTQAVFGTLNLTAFNDTYQNQVAKTEGIINSIVEKNVNRLIAKGVGYHQFTGLDLWLDEIAGSIAEIKSVSFVDYGQIKDYAQVQKRVLLTDGLNEKRFLVIGRDFEAMSGVLRTVMLDALTVMVTSLFFMLEILLFAITMIKSRVLGTNTAKDNGTRIRTAAFLIFISTSMCTSFIPILTKELMAPLWGFDLGVLITLPVTVEIATSIFTTLLTGKLADRLGWKAPFMLGVLFLGLGALASGMANSLALLIGARAIAGMGYGFSWMAMRAFASAQPSQTDRSQTLAALNAGIYSGINCGIVIGAMLAERVGYTLVFYVSLALLALSVAYVPMAFKAQPKIVAASAAGGNPKKGSPWRSYLDPKLIFYMICLVIPSSVALMFLNYYIPLYGKATDISVSNIGRIFLLYGLAMVIVGPLYPKLSKGFISIQTGVLLSVAMKVVALVGFGLLGSFSAAVVTVILIALSDSVGVVALVGRYYELEAVKNLGVGQAMSYYSILSKIGQMIGPAVIGLATAMEFTRGMVYLGGLTFILLILYTLVFSRRGESLKA